MGFLRRLGVAGIWPPVLSLVFSCLAVSAKAQESAALVPASQSSAPAAGGTFFGGLGSFFEGVGKTVGGAVTGARDTPMITDLKPGVYEKSNEAIGEQKDLDEARITRGILEVPSFAKYANGVLVKLKAASMVDQVPGQVIVVANEQLDAYSSPDGNIYVSAGYLRSLTSEDQLAALLAHELSHVLLRHHDSNAIGRVQKQASTFFASGAVLRNAMDTAMAGAGSQALSAGQTDVLKKMELLIKLNDGALGPAWGRRQEREADRLGMDLMVKAGYSYDSLLEWLELIAKWDAEQAAKREQDVKIQQDAMKTLMESGKLEQGVKQGLDFALNDVLAQLKTDHDVGEKRQEDMNEYFTYVYKESVPRVTKTTKPFDLIKAQPDVKPVMDGYRDAYLARTLIQHQNYDAALKTLAPLVGKKSAIAAHALPNQLMFEAYLGKGRDKEAETYLRRSIDAPNSVWEAYGSAAKFYKGKGDLNEIVKVGQSAFNRFSGAPSAYPKLISLYRSNGLLKEAESVRSDCVFKQADRRDECMSAAKGS